jgi:hypothetical protein
MSNPHSQFLPLKRANPFNLASSSAVLSGNPFHASGHNADKFVGLITNMSRGKEPASGYLLLFQSFKIGTHLAIVFVLKFNRRSYNDKKTYHNPGPHGTGPGTCLCPG